MRVLCQADRSPRFLVMAACSTLLLALFPAISFAQGIRSQAVVQLSFDEAAGSAVDSATVGAAKDDGALINAPARIRSPFWNQAGKQALVLDAGARQLVQLNDSPDLDRRDAVTVGLLFVNLHPKSDTPFHGLVAKRDDGRSNITNYGINYGVQSDTFQLYVNDGTGFKAALFSTDAAVGYRRPGYITAVFQIGDAPAPDADEDKDDVLIRFYTNGKPIRPKGVNGGIAVENDAWLTDVQVATLVNDAPVTIGSSMPALEHTSCVIDEFSLFPKALTAEEIAALFKEVAGENVEATMAAEAQPLPAAPEITGLSLRGLQSGGTSVLAVSGTNLTADPQLVLPFVTQRNALRPGGTNERAEFDVAIPAEVPAGHYPVRIQTPHGISGALTLAVDSLPQVPFVESSPEKPVALPVAISGTLSGQQQARVFFAGKAGQRVVIDLECKRLGSGMDPVLELRNPRGAPLAIAWGKGQYRGDTRIEATLFADGVHSVDLHDLAYKAPGDNSYRLKIGDLKIVDAVFPPALTAAAEPKVSPIGPGMPPQSALPIERESLVPGVPQPIPLPATMGAVGPAPLLTPSDSKEVVEAATADGQLQSVDAQFNTEAHVPVVVNGRIARPAEIDRYRLTVKPGMTLTFAVESYSLRSPLDAQVVLVSPVDGSVLAASEERASVDFAVPAQLSEVHLLVRDLNGRGGNDYLYRLRIVPTGQPNFSLALDRERVTLSRDGTAVLRLDVNRAGYDGPISLSLSGAPELSVTPAEIPAGASKALLLLSSRLNDANPAALIRKLRLTGQSQGLTPPIRRVVLAPADGRLSLVPAQRAELTVTLALSSGAELQLSSLPGALFKGTEFAVPISLQVKDDRLSKQAVRLTLLTTETPRSKVDPTDPFQQRRLPLPLVRSLAEQSLVAGEAGGQLKVAVPLDVAEASLDCIVRAEFVPHPFSENVVATIYSAPFRLNVQPAVAIELSANALNLTGKQQAKFTGKVKRTVGYAEPVSVSLANLQAGYVAPPVVVAPGQEEFEILVTAPEVTAAAVIPNVVFRVTNSAGASLQNDVAVTTKVEVGQ